MADLVEIEFPSEEKAEEVRQKLLDMQKEYLIELVDAVIAVKQPNGHVKLNQLFNPTASGAVSGTFWGALIGLIFLMPLAGAAIGAASGALGLAQQSRFIQQCEPAFCTAFGEQFGQLFPNAFSGNLDYLRRQAFDGRHCRCALAQRLHIIAPGDRPGYRIGPRRNCPGRGRARRGAASCAAA